MISSLPEQILSECDCVRIVTASTSSPCSPRTWHSPASDVGQEGQGRRDHERSLRVSDYGAERRGRRHPSKGDAGDRDDARRGRDLDDRAGRRGAAAAAAVSGRDAPDRRPRRQGRFRAGRGLSQSLSSHCLSLSTTAELSTTLPSRLSGTYAAFRRSASVTSMTCGIVSGYSPACSLVATR